MYPFGVYYFARLNIKHNITYNYVVYDLCSKNTLLDRPLTYYAHQVVLANSRADTHQHWHLVELFLASWPMYVPYYTPVFSLAQLLTFNFPVLRLLLTSVQWVYLAFFAAK